jgi:hypothetical protein
VRAHLAAPICGIVIGAWEQLAGACHLNDIDGTVAPELRALSVEGDEEVQPLARVSVRYGEQCGISDVEIGLVERHLREVLRILVLEPVALYFAPALGIEGFVLPDQGVDQIDARQVGTVNDDAVGVAAERATGGGKGERLGRRKLESGRYETPARSFLEIVPAIKDLARPGGERRFASPIVLNAAGAVVSDDRRAQIGARKLLRPRCRALNRVVDGDVDRLER